MLCLRRQRSKFAHRRRPPAVIDRHNNLCSLADLRLYVADINGPIAAVDIGEAHRGAQEHCGVRCRDIGQRRHDHIVALGHAGRKIGRVQSRGAGTERDGKTRAGIARKRAFEALHSRTLREPITAQHPRHGAHVGLADVLRRIGNHQIPRRFNYGPRCPAITNIRSHASHANRENTGCVKKLAAGPHVYQSTG